jgi:hypothetical protein
MYIDLGAVAEDVRRRVAEMPAEAAVDPRADRGVGREHQALAVELDRP